MNLLYFILIGALAGWIAGQIMKGRGFGCLGNVVVGIIGAVVGGHVLSAFGVEGKGLTADLITAVAGAVLFLFLVGMLRKSQK